MIIKNLKNFSYKMCGIIGIIGNQISKEYLNSDKLKLALNHRGPDFTDHIFIDPIFFIHNRLSIIDLDKRAHQPFFSNDRSKVIIFNGEIYNYQEIKKELLNSYEFKTLSDTEVLLAAYERWGTKCLDKFKGAFAFCIYDFKKKIAFFARDRFGQKPIFFWKNKNNLHFASEIKGLIASGYKAEPNYQIWYDYLNYGKTDHSRDTFFKDIFQLLPGEFAIFKTSEGIKINKWYKLEDNISNKNNSLNIKGKILDKLSESIELNSRADVPLTLSLSGGLDSSILMSLGLKNKIFDKNPRCYSVVFEKDFSEKEYIDNSTNYYGFKSNFINFSQKEFKDSIEPMVWSLESPSGGLMNCALAKLCNQIKKDRYKIILDGTGLDEGFGGYEIHHLKYLLNLKKIDAKKFDISLKLFSENWGIPNEKIINKLDSMQNVIPKTIDGFDMINYNLINKNFSENFKNKKNFKKINTGDLVKDSLIEYIQQTKIPRNNRLKDRISMAFGLELRLPFLEHDLLEYALSLNTKSYFLNGKSKSILRYSVKNFVQNRVRKAKKFSIQSPQNTWLKKEPMKSYIENLINCKNAKDRNIFDIKNLKIEWQKFLDGKFDTSFFIWQFINTEMWFQTFIDKSSENVNKSFNFD